LFALVFEEGGGGFEFIRGVKGAVKDWYNG